MSTSRPARMPARRSQLRAVALLMCLILGMSLLVLAPTLSWYSELFELPSSRMLTLTEAQADSIISSHEFVLLAGPHRGGTTLLWRLLAAYNGTSAFAEHANTDFGEGIFLQDVLPTFGVGREIPGAASRATGLGRYALSLGPDSYTETSPLLTRANRVRLLAQWGARWDLSRRVLLEKSPTHMVTSRLLQALLAPSATFVFITRHPLAVALAHRRWPCCASDSVLLLATHWLV